MAFPESGSQQVESLDLQALPNPHSPSGSLPSLKPIEAEESESLEEDVDIFGSDTTSIAISMRGHIHEDRLRYHKSTTGNTCFLMSKIETI